MAPLALFSVSCKKAEAPKPAPRRAARRRGAAAAAAPANAPPGVPGAPPAVKPMPPQIPDVLARVNGEKIERWEFDNAVKRMEARAGGPVPPDKRDEVLRGVLDQLVAYHLLAQESRARKLPVADADVDARLAEIRKSFPTEEAFKQGIAAQGLTLGSAEGAGEDQPRGVEGDRRRGQLEDRGAGPRSEGVLRPEPGALQAGRQRARGAHPDRACRRARRRSRRPRPRPRRAAVLKTIKAGGDFATLARANSQDPGSAQNGGDLGFFPKGQMTPAFEEAAFKLKPGTVSALVETPFGFHIIKVIERRAPRTAPFEEVSGQIKDFLTQGQREQKLEQFVEQVKAKGKIEILV